MTTIEPINRLTTQLSRLPGIGHKTAQRLAYHILDIPEAQAADRPGRDGGIPGGDPEEEALRREESSCLRQALLSLDLRKREILILNYFENFTLKEAAVIMGISYENARILSMRAKRELRRIMEVNGYEIL